MTHKLEVLDATRLSNAEAGKLIASTLSVFEVLPPAGPQDDFSVIQFYVDKLTSQHNGYLLTFNQTRANKDTDEIERLDSNRDQAMKAFRRFVKASQYLDAPAEAAAAHALQLLMNGYADTETLSYEGESETIDKLLVELTGKYALNVKQLGLDRLVTRLQTANNAFKTLYNSRTNTVALEQTGNARTLRLEMLKTYREYALYVQAMANTPMGGYFVQLLSLINQVRKNYAVLIAQRQGVAAAKEKKSEPDVLLQ
jgi:HPt (histidine-containing phosphotransfer) domain-containing protein